MKKFAEVEIIEDIIEVLENGYSGYYEDLHNEVFNTNYYIVGTSTAKEALNEYGVFKAIEEVQNYEQEQFGEVYTDLSNPEKVANMLYYILGEKFMGKNHSIFGDKFGVATEEENAKIILELEELL